MRVCIAICMLISIVATAPSIDRIVGGHGAALGQFPHQISLQKRDHHVCGGSIVSSHCVVTAAHCVAAGPRSSFTVKVGINKLSEPGAVYEVESSAIHPKWTARSNDVAVVRTKLPIDFNQLVQPIPLSEEFIKGGKDLVVSGWGKIFIDGPTPNNLQFLHLTSISQAECEWKLNITFPDVSQMCTLTTYGEGTCQGDSGGPLILNRKLVGVVSWGRPCAIGYPDVFTRISAVSDWIKEICPFDYYKEV